MNGTTPAEPMGPMSLRPATDADRAGILGVHASAFGEEQGPEIVDLVDRLIRDETAIPLFSLVAEADGRVVGHVLFTAVRLPPGSRPVSAQILAPLAVSKEHQGQGIGSALIGEGLKRLAAAGVELVFVLGDPDYYRRFGFRPAGAVGYEAPYPTPPEHADAWMVQELKTGALGKAPGRIRCAATLDEPRHWVE